jgi:hypothetical protein
LTGKNRKYTNQVAEKRWLPSLKETGQMLLTFFLVVIGWIIFRSTGIHSFVHYIDEMLQLDTLRASYQFFTLPEMWPANLFIVIMLVMEWLSRNKQHGLSIENLNVVFRWLLYSIFVLLVVYEGGQPAPFVYFQF